MATQKQREAPKRNVRKAQSAAQSKQTLKHLSSATRTALPKEAAAVNRGDAPTRRELEQEARRLDISGRSKMGKAELKRAFARAKGSPFAGATRRARRDEPHDEVAVNPSL